MTIFSCMVPEIWSATDRTEIWSATDRIFCHSGLFFALLPPPPLHGPNKSKFCENEKNTWRYYHFTNINDSHMMHGSSDIECNRQNFLSFWAVFCPFTTQKIKILKNWKKTRDIIILHMFTINDNHMMYSSWDIERDRHNDILSFYTSVP